MFILISNLRGKTILKATILTTFVCPELQL